MLGQFDAAGQPEGAQAIVAIRPQGICVKPAGSGVPARVEHRQFLGVVDLVEFAVEGLDRPLKGRIREPVPSVKQDVGIEIDPAEVLVFAAPGA